MGLHKRLYDDYVWGLKYRPKTVDEMILPDRYKKMINKIIEDGKIGNILIAGSYGLGKTTMAALIVDAMDRDFLYINGSSETGVSVLRTKINDFISTKSWNGERKIVVVDEFDRASGNLQDGFKVVIEEFSKTCNFILLSNHKNRIIPAVMSRVQTIDFSFTRDETKTLKRQFFKAVRDILDVENVNYDLKAVAFVVDRIFPDMRRTLNELQNFALQGILSDLDAVKQTVADLTEYFRLLRDRDFTGMKEYVAALPIDAQSFYSQIYDACLKYVDPETIGEFVEICGRKAYESAFVADTALNVGAFSAEVMAVVKFKDNF